MDNISNRRGFFRNASVFASTLLLNSVPTALGQAKDLVEALKKKSSVRALSDIEDFLNPNYLFIDDSIPGELLIQAFDFQLGADFTFKESGLKKVVIYCFNLRVNGAFENPGGSIFIVCRNLICGSNASMSVNGFNGMSAGKQPSECTDEFPNGKDGDNLNIDGSQIMLNGFPAGICDLHFEEIHGDLSISAVGGQGGKGEDGAEGCNGRNGKNGTSERTSCANRGRATQGEDGLPPGINGAGASGGSGGQGGRIDVSSLEDIKTSNLDVATGLNTYYFDKGKIQCRYNGGGKGAGGNGANAVNHGGSGGIGGEKFDCHREPRGGPIHDRSFVSVSATFDIDFCDCTSAGRAPSGIDRTAQLSVPANNGVSGPEGAKGVSECKGKTSEFLTKMPTSYVRILLLKAEYLYINKQLETCTQVLIYISNIDDQFKSKEQGEVDLTQISSYLPKESINDFKPIFSKAILYLDQISRGLDFWANPNNYVTLLDQYYINNEIQALYIHFKDFEDQVVHIASRDLTYKTSANYFATQRTKNTNLISELQQELIKKDETLALLHVEIKQRLQETIYRRAELIKKEADFKNAVENSSKGCSFASVLSGISQIVTIATGLASGVGAIVAVTQVISKTVALKNDFLDKVDEVAPGLSPSKWKNVLKDEQFVTKVEKIKDLSGKFTDNVEKVQQAFRSNEEVHAPSGLIAMQRDEFKAQIKDYIGKYPEAKAFQDEFLAFLDFNDLTNQKRQELTDTFMAMVEITNRIHQLNIDNANLSVAAAKNEEKKVDSRTKFIFLDAYLKSKQLLLKLIYLQSKSIDYLTLSQTEFNAELYSYGIKALNENYLTKNALRLNNFLNNSVNVRAQGATINPIVIKKEEYPFTFSKFITGEVLSNTGQKIHRFYFSISPIDGKYLQGTESEVYLTAAKVIIKGIKNIDDNISFTLKHSGNSLFIRSQDGSHQYFSHRPVLRGMTYNIKKPKQYKDQFDSLLSISFENSSGKSPYIGVSPFADWVIEVNPAVPINKGIDFTGVTSIEIMFQYYATAFSS
jgi:hypothetical protein